MQIIKFYDTIPFDSATKTAISVRDGVQNYYGIEIGKEPSNKLFKVYRSPATIGNIARMMDDLPLTNNHVEFEKSKELAIGKVVNSELVDFKDEELKSTLCIKNKLNIDKEDLTILDNKHELSLGYESQILPSSDPNYDFIQQEIKPVHLAVVTKARGGEVCKIIDSKGVLMLDKLKNVWKSNKTNKFKDEEGNDITMEQIMELVASMPDAIKKLTPDQLQTLVPAFQEINRLALSNDPTEDPDVDNKEDENTDDKEDDLDEVTKKEVTDNKAKKQVNNSKNTFRDADIDAIVNKKVNEELSRFSQVTEKAKQFMDSSYSFVGKTTDEIMKDVVRSQTGKEYQGNALKIAFDVLQKPRVSYANFIDESRMPNASLSQQLKDAKLNNN